MRLILLVASFVCLSALARPAGKQLPDPIARAVQLGEEHVERSKILRDHRGPPRTDLREVGEAAKAMRDVLLDEIEGPAAPIWAGRYSNARPGGMRAETCWVGPGGLAYLASGCVGEYDDANTGVIAEVRSDRVIVDLQLDPLRNRVYWQADVPYAVMDRELLFVIYEGDRYLIPRSSMVPFCNALNLGSGFDRLFLVRRSDPNPSDPAEGGILVPEEYERFVLGQPLVGTIVSAGHARDDGEYASGTTRRVLEATVDLGWADGLLPGMVLLACSGDHRRAGVVTRVAERTATLEYRFPVAPDVEPVPLPEQGWTVTSRYPSKE